jgi:hypothetical protein
MDSQFVFNLVKYEIGDQAGGAKLVYKVKEIECIKIFNIHIPVSTRREKEVVFLRPFKIVWGTTKNKKDVRYLANNFLGKPKDPFLNLWIILEKDYTDFRKDFQTLVRIKTLCKEKEYHILVKHLSKPSKSFILEYNTFLAIKLF